MKEIRFSRHALGKFEILAAHGFHTNQAAVIEVVINPDQVDRSQSLFTAQKKISDNTVLRVVYTESDDEYFIITFYPGKRRRYEG